MTALPTTEVFAFSAPKSKAGEIAIAVNVGAGALHVLHATRSVWRNLYDRLAAEFAPAPASIVPTTTGPRQIVKRLQGEDRYRVFSAVLIRIEREEISQRAACEAAGVSLGAFSMWLKEYRRTGYRPPADLRPAGRVPVTKPNGKLL